MAQKTIEGQPETSHTNTSHFCSIHFSILQSGPISPEWSPSLRFLKKACHFLFSTLCSTKPFQFSLFFDFAKIFYPLLYSQRYLLPQIFFGVRDTCEEKSWKTEKQQSRTKLWRNRKNITEKNAVLTSTSCVYDSVTSL